MLKPGDIIGLKALWWQKWMTYGISPPIDRVHFFILGRYIPEDDDWIIYESLLSRGVRIGRLSWYKGQHATVYRLPDESKGELAANTASEYGRERYDYLLILRLFGLSIKYWCTHGIRRIPFYVLTDTPNRSLLCVELVVQVYKDYVRLVPEGVVATPSAIEQARIDGKLLVVFEGIIE